MNYLKNQKIVRFDLNNKFGLTVDTSTSLSSNVIRKYKTVTKKN